MSDLGASGASAGHARRTSASGVSPATGGRAYCRRGLAGRHLSPFKRPRWAHQILPALQGRLRCQLLRERPLFPLPLRPRRVRG